MAHEYPVGKAQKIILEALGRGDIATFSGANDYFDRIGITVIAKRVGRTSVPVVRMKETEGGGFTEGGDGESWEIGYEEVDLSKIEQWMEK